MQQLALPFPQLPRYQPESFLVSDCNRRAWMWMQPHQSWLKPVLLLRGEAASGKSHLAAIWAGRHNAPMIAASTLESGVAPEQYFAGGKMLVVEDIEQLLLGSNPLAAQERLFHLYNVAMQNELSLLLTLHDQVEWESFSLPDLRSRLQATPQARIAQPDELLLAALLVKHLQDRQLPWNDALLGYILPRLERSFQAVREFVEQLDALALRQKKPISIALARQILYSAPH
jgi:chromosomal replication initiation ATPase DnaA